MAKIEKIFAKEIKDSRGNPTLEVTVSLDDGKTGQAAVPSGASTGEHEAIELRDADGKGVQAALKNVNEVLAGQLVGQDLDQAALDEKMIGLDATATKSRLGANAILGISMAFAHAAGGEKLYEYFGEISGQKNPTLPMPMLNFLEGGKHAKNSTDFQEYLIMPLAAKNFAEALSWAQKVFDQLREVLSKKNLATTLGDEGGFAPILSSNEEPFELLSQAITAAGFVPGKDIALALDVASSELYRDGKYVVEGKPKSAEEMIVFYENLVNKFPIYSIEDALAEDDWENYRVLTEKLGEKIQLVGDDLFVTNPERLAEGIVEKVANAVLVKPNQIGTVSETIKVIKMAQKAGYRPIISHRSGETMDTTIADLAVGTGAGQIKTGGLTQQERLAKYNRLLAIEEELGSSGLLSSPRKV